MDRTAFLMIDVQNDFCPGGALAVPDGDAVVPLINRLQDRFGVRVLTQDWHPADHASFASNHAGAEPFSMTEMPYGPQVLWPDHCVQGTPGAAFHPDLRTDPADLILRKGFRAAIDSYSAFFENDHETPTGLEGYLRTRGVEAVPPISASASRRSTRRSWASPLPSSRMPAGRSIWTAPWPKRKRRWRSTGCGWRPRTASPPSDR